MKKKNLLMTAVSILSFATISMAQVPSYVPTNGLIGWWPFNGNANDESGNNNNGTVIGAVLTIDRFGSANNAFSFNGTSDYIRCINAGPTGNPNITLSFWVKTSQTTASDIFNWGNGTIAGQDFRACFNEAGCAGVTFDNYNSAITYSTTTNNNTWEHYVVVYDSIVGSSVLSSRAYKNGILLSSVCFTQNFDQTNIGSANPITIGRYNKLTSTPQPPNYFSGILDDIGFWNRVLTQQEITDLYASINVGIENISSDDLFSVFPNPAQSVVNVKADSKLFGMTYSIYDNTGKVVLSGKINSENTVIELGNLSGGIYLFSVGENMKQTFKVIKE